MHRFSGDSAGAGAAHVPRFLIDLELRSGMLVTPFAQSRSGDDAYYLVRREGWESQSALVEFGARIFAQTEELRSAEPRDP